MRSWDDLIARLKMLSLDEASAMISILERRQTGDDLGVPPAIQSLADIVLLMHVKGSKLRFVEDVLVQTALRAERGNKSAAARLLCIERKSLERKAMRSTVARVTPPEGDGPRLAKTRPSVDHRPRKVRP
jgi:DNA-binding NtrC family response regulator